MEQNVLEYIHQRQDIITKLRDLLIETSQLDFEPARLDPDTTLFGSGFGLDSIDAVEILVGVEQIFGVDLGGANILGPLYLRTINTITDIIMEKRGLS